ncbi:hypothetical protein KN1_18760 [Stygiolobus caldivivus]|uniref:tRNA(Ile2) 2-agmatinylcytidine synthetase TiaS n=2 Tax=Stygiolobus caldivivus TaxID=2824673 RepID=A0A8D5U770_9CREN|nr:tRNA(Ile)(2)-agmatinylcytidine synthase [Stygiolobus caldivivus]BCU70579.1 hypothetical protein KN1_18760 [Stygiolobus caldivivus]
MRYLKEKYNVVFTDFPYLVRLNPNIPWKTRGNASVRLTIRANIEISELAEIVWQKSLEYVEYVSNYTKFNRKPGIAITYLSNLSKLESFYEKAVRDIIPLDLAKKVSEKYGIITRGERGIIGSIASLGFNPDKKGFTYELLTYKNDSESRQVDEETVIKFDERHFPYVFSNYDYVKKEVQIISHGNDPVLYGVRGTDPYVLASALEEIKVLNRINGAMIFKTNQGTDDHIIGEKGTYYQTFRSLIKVATVKILRGGDVVVISEDQEAIIFYKETGELNEASKLLKQGDEIIVTGSLKPSSIYGRILEAENMTILSLDAYTFSNPRCPKCNGSTESIGRDKGFRCKKCGYKFHGEKQKKEITRGLITNIQYQSRKYRHLTKPIFLEYNRDNLDVLAKQKLVHYLLYYQK